MTLIQPGSTIGFLGGGQLGRMMAISAREMGYRIAVLEPTENSPCGQISDIVIQAQYDDRQGAIELAEHCDVLTYEFENIDKETARWLQENLYLPQGYKLLETSQHRGREKNAIQSFGLPVAPFYVLETFEQLEDAIQKIGIPSVLKTCTGGYDGKGQVVIRSDEDIQPAFEELEGKGELVLEKWIVFEKELSVIVTRNVSGEVKTFPVAENIHRNNILHQTIVPARIDESIQEQAKKMAVRLADGLEMVGTLAVEMFLNKDGEIYINEVAPRPHNSGHYTMNACKTSQFEQHIRAICDLPLGETTLVSPVVMVNILGEHVPAVMDKLSQFDTVKLHFYGKEEAKQGRKMGHINVLADSVEEALSKIEKLAIWE
ncbi:5-(carboxyamino)imidazole ribonucleotide synthase [Bacillus alkalicellulosilyticus]|uniref:5-(carboxyamino)imidazole ribonucleotide synthase n=1 Tax=Alkalihalobacterium alkalicellulosilyticum TaxID=1912214 RepID=UPI000995FF88|nr:5-(carboxyamino)imidazole ribonucleotide synthase [Bacillus alkalicellulosilyticus]